MAGSIQHHTYHEGAVDSGDVGEFASIYKQHRLSIYRYILARVGHVEDAQDLTAQVFLKAYQNLASYRGDASIVYWLIGIARYQIIDYHRSAVNDVPLDAFQEMTSSALPIEDALEKEIRLRRVSEALNALSEDRREALSLRLFAHLSNPEIAEIMGKSPEAVAMLVYRGIHDLKKRLGDEEAI